MKRLLSLFSLIFLSICSFAQGTNSLIAHWDFNGSANDVSGNGLNGIAIGTTSTEGYNGQPNTAYSFNGAGDHIYVPYNPLLNTGSSFSICVLIKPMGFYSGLCQSNTILSRDDQPATDHYKLQYCDNSYDNSCNVFSPAHENFEVESSSMSWVQGTDADSLWVDTPIVTGRWYCVVGTYDGQTANLYVDGNLRKTFTSASDNFVASTNGLGIGQNIAADSTEYPYWLNGIIDDMRLYGRVLSAEEVNMYCDSAESAVTNSIPQVPVSAITLSPNPVQSTVTVSLPQDYIGGNMQVINQLGQVVFTQKIAGSKSDIDLSRLSAGVYILKAQNNNVMEISKLIKD